MKFIIFSLFAIASPLAVVGASPKESTESTESTTNTKTRALRGIPQFDPFEKPTNEDRRLVDTEACQALQCPSHPVVDETRFHPLDEKGYFQLDSKVEELVWKCSEDNDEMVHKDLEWQREEQGNYDWTCPSEFQGVPIGCWDTSGVQNFKHAFPKYRNFNESLSCWDTSKATDMTGMFLRVCNFNQ
jgi:hypothetical protein